MSLEDLEQTPRMPETLEPKKYVRLAEDVIKSLGEKRADGTYIFSIETQDLTEILNLLTEIYHMASRKQELSDGIQEQIGFLKLCIIRESGQKKEVKDFVERAQLIRYIENIGMDKERFILFYRYMEALVAYLKFFGGNLK